MPTARRGSSRPSGRVRRPARQGAAGPRPERRRVRPAVRGRVGRPVVPRVGSPRDGPLRHVQPVARRRPDAGPGDGARLGPRAARRPRGQPDRPRPVGLAGLDRPPAPRRAGADGDRPPRVHRGGRLNPPAPRDRPAGPAPVRRPGDGRRPRRPRLLWVYRRGRRRSELHSWPEKAYALADSSHVLRIDADRPSADRPSPKMESTPGNGLAFTALPHSAPRFSSRL